MASEIFHYQSKVEGHDDFYNFTHPDVETLEGVSDDDAGWIGENVPQVVALREGVIDDSPRSEAAALVADIMTEFVVEGSEFTPSTDTELCSWLGEIIKKEVNGISEDEVSELIAQIIDFPPLDGSSLVNLSSSQKTSANA